MIETRILVIDKMHPSLTAMLAAHGYQADYRPDIGRAEILDIIGGYGGVVVRSKTTIDEPLLQRAANLRFVARAGAGLDQIDTGAVARRGIRLFNAPEGNRDAVAEHALAMLLALMNHLPRADRQVRQGRWDREGNRGTELLGKTVGVIGYGNTGRAFARRVRAFGCQVLAYDKYQAGFSDEFALESSLDHLFAQARVVSLHVPLTPETHGWFTEEVFGRFANPVFFVNTSRGEIAPLADLHRCLQTGKVLGACLDVLENERLDTLTPGQRSAFEALAASENVLFSPHVAGWTHESYRKINEVLVRKITGAFPVPGFGAAPENP